MESRTEIESLGQVVVFKGHEFRVLDGEPRVQDLKLAEWLGFGRHLKIRDLIKHMKMTGIINDSEVFTVRGITSSAGGRPATEFWLTETGALLLATKSETPNAIALTREIVETFVAVRRHTTEQKSPSAEALEVATNRLVAHARYIGESKSLSRDLRVYIAAAMAKQGVSRQRIAGHIRKSFNVTSEFQVPTVQWEELKDDLANLIDGYTALPHKPSKLKTDGRQLILFADAVKDLKAKRAAQLLEPKPL